jgi:hypothetical protein
MKWTSPAEPIQFCYGHRTPLTTSFVECSGQLRATIKGVCTLACLDLNEHADQLETLRHRKAVQGLALRLNA